MTPSISLLILKHDNPLCVFFGHRSLKLQWDAVTFVARLVLNLEEKKPCIDCVVQARGFDWGRPNLHENLSLSHSLSISILRLFGEFVGFLLLFSVPKTCFGLIILKANGFSVHEVFSFVQVEMYRRAVISSD